MYSLCPAVFWKLSNWPAYIKNCMLVSSSEVFLDDPRALLLSILEPNSQKLRINLNKTLTCFYIAKFYLSLSEVIENQVPDFYLGNQKYSNVDSLETKFEKRRKSNIKTYLL